MREHISKCTYVMIQNPKTDILEGVSKRSRTDVKVYCAGSEYKVKVREKTF